MKAYLTACFFISSQLPLQTSQLAIEHFMNILHFSKWPWRFIPGLYM